MKISNSKPIKRSEPVELVIKTATGKHTFSEIDSLRGRKIKVIDISRIANCTHTPSGKAIVNETVFKKSFLVLSVKGSEAINRLPLSALDPGSNAGHRIQFDDVLIDWVKSFVEIPELTGVVINEAFLFNVYFEEIDCP